MTDHITEAERFHNEYLRLRTPGRVPKLADVLALANYHATMAVHDAIRGLAPNAAQDAAGGDLTASQPEPGQVDGGKATEAGEFSDCPRCDRHLRAVQHFKSRAEKAEAQLESSRRGGVVLSATDYNALAQRAERAEAEAKMQQQRARHFKSQNEQAEAERDAILADLREARAIWDASDAHERLSDIIDRHTPEG